MVAVAIDYYEHEQSQQSIAEKYQISRMTVSNLLKRCREEGIVDIRVNKKPSLAFALQSELQSRLKMERISVCTSDSEVAHTRITVGRAAADILKAELRDHLKIGISYGTTLFETVRQFSVSKHYTNVEVVQLLGALGSRDSLKDGSELARTLSNKLDASCRFIQAPLVVQTLKLKEMLLKEPQIAEAFALARTSGVAVLGISSNRPEISGIVRAGFLSADESAALYDEGAVGNVCGIHFDVEGTVLPIPLNDRTISISPDDLRAIPVRIGVAFGTCKANAILGAIHAGFVNKLVTDTDAAMRIISDLS
jgi:DNA-binding transcriptional regulator LsrR (DeoR family)